MSRAIALLIIGLAFGGGLGFLVAASYGVTLDGHDHATDHGPGVTDHAAHDHGKLVEVTGPTPTLAITVAPDPVAGWNLEVQTTNFTFAPSRSGAAHVDGEGHAHLYANGVKLARIYGEWHHIDSLPQGDVQVMVTLNSNGHQTLAANGAPLQAMVMVSNTP